MDHAFENGRRVPVTSSTYDAFDVDPTAVLLAAREATARVIDLATESRRPECAGRRVLAMAWVLGAMPVTRTQLDLARLLGCSEPHTSRLIFMARLSLRNPPSDMRTG